MRLSSFPFARLWLTLVIAMAVCVCALPALADELPADPTPVAIPAASTSTDGLFWTPRSYGSESQFNPLTAFINGGFDILRNAAYDDHLLGPAYGMGAVNVLNNVAVRPLTALDFIGWGKFGAHEVFPYRGLDTRYGQFVPNWFMHGLGEGLLYRKLEDWYRHYDVPAPRLMAILTTTAMQFLNEMTENGDFRGWNQDPIADMLIWNPLGFALFSIDPIARFFRGPIKLDYWPGQAAITNGFRLTNQGENYAFKIALGLPIDLRFFMYYGKQGLFGAAFPVNAHDNLSIGVGPSLKGMVAEYVNGSRMMIPGDQLVWETAVFWDRDESLMASLFAGLTQSPYVAANVYPGLIEIGGWSLGAFARWSRDEGSSAGLTLRGSPLGLGWIQRENDHPAQQFH